MIGVDTNILLRFVVGDDPSQYKKVERFLMARSARSPAFISVGVILEFAWALRSTFGYAKADVLRLLTEIVKTEHMLVEYGGVVEQTIAHVANSNVSSEDALISLIDRRNGCTTTMTFDRDAARKIEGMELFA